MPTTEAFKTFAQTVSRVREARANHLGYPFSFGCDSGFPRALDEHLLLNLGDPYAGSHFGSEVCGLEREVIGWFLDLWQCDDQAAFWGSVVTGGTEGNLWAIYLGREALPGAVLLYGADAHYSMPKSARLLGIDSIAIDSDEGGAMEMGSLRRALAAVEGRPVIVVLTCGTTMTGAHDDIGAVIAQLEEMEYGPGRRYIHVDGALNAMVLPFLPDAPKSIQPTFRHGIDSLCTSGHKMIGTPMPCGVLVARRAHVERIAKPIPYIGSYDTTLTGSRNGHAVLAIWMRLFGHGREGYAADARDCLARTGRLAEALRGAGVPLLWHPFSLTLVFPEPAESIVTKYQLACLDGQAHAIVMPSVTDAVVDRFSGDYAAWWRSKKRSVRAPRNDAASMDFGDYWGA